MHQRYAAGLQHAHESPLRSLPLQGCRGSSAYGAKEHTGRPSHSNSQCLGTKPEARSTQVLTKCSSMQEGLLLSIKSGTGRGTCCATLANEKTAKEKQCSVKNKAPPP